MTSKKIEVKKLSLLMAFIFGGTIVGETVSLSMVISVAGSQILSKLYLINGVMLFLLPPIYLKRIDRENRGELLSKVLINISILLLLFSTLFTFGNVLAGKLVNKIIYIVYPISYLTKSILFLTFWTLANDLSLTSETKKEFPKISAWGFAGGLIGALLSRLLLEVMNASGVMFIWSFSYVIAFFTLKSIIKYNPHQLYRQETIEKEQQWSIGISQNIMSVTKIELVRLISLFYFVLFIAIFLIDFLFWDTCSKWFSNSESLASFQFSFYISHGIVTVLGLMFITPILISRYGFTNIFSYLPIVLLLGPIAIITSTFLGVNEKNVFAIMIIVQFLRYVVFENAFSPIYQMFFASISKDKRGRAKTLIEGVIKPVSIITAGLLILFLNNHKDIILYSIPFIALILIYVVRLISVSYLKRLVHGKSFEKSSDKLITDIGSNYDQKVVAILKEYSASKSPDIRGLAVQILSELGTKQSLFILMDIYENEKELHVKEMVAGGLQKFYWYETKEFIELLLDDENDRTIGNAISSLNKMNCYWKWRLRDRVREILFSGSLRTKVEAASYLWNGNDKSERDNVTAFVKALEHSYNEDERAASIYLMSQLKVKGWEKNLENNLEDSSDRIFSRSLEQILRVAPLKNKINALKLVENKNRTRVKIAGQIVRKIGEPVLPAILGFMKYSEEMRMLFEMVYSLRIIRESGAKSVKRIHFDKDTENKLNRKIAIELEKLYYGAYVWVEARNNGAYDNRFDYLFDYAMEEYFLRVIGWALDIMAILEPGGVIAMGRKDLDLREVSQRHDMLEIIKSFGQGRLKIQVMPLLEYTNWEKIAKAGKQLFHFALTHRDRYRYFINSDNRWASLIALYCVYKEPKSKQIAYTFRDDLKRISEDGYGYNKVAAKLILTPNGEKEISLNSFDLLETVLFYKKIPLFQSVPAERLMGLAEISELVKYKKGEKVSNENDISEHMYIIKSGSVRVEKAKKSLNSVVAILQSGDTYGEIGLFNQAPRSASAIANTDCEIFVIQREELKKLLMEIPEIAFNFLKAFGQKLKNSSEEIALLNVTLTESNKKR